MCRPRAHLRQGFQSQGLLRALFERFQLCQCNLGGLSLARALFLKPRRTAHERVRSGRTLHVELDDYYPDVDSV